VRDNAMGIRLHIAIDGAGAAAIYIKKQDY
jgi:hypothetical protein